MFDEGRSKKVIFVAHCILNQNSISDGTACFPGCVNVILELLCSSEAGIIQMPCPEFHCLGLDRGDVNGSSRPVVEENTRIRKVLSQGVQISKIRQLAQDVVFQILEYQKHNFEVIGVVGINRSPSCGVNTTSRDNQEVDGRGVFIETLRGELDRSNIYVDIVGIKPSETEEAIITLRQLFDAD